MDQPKYKRILLKISGEQLSGADGHGIDSEFINWLADEIISAAQSGVQIALVPGGGNIVRGSDLAGNGIKEETAHYMGMLAIVINGMALADVFGEKGQKVKLVTRLHVNDVAEPYDKERANQYLDDGNIVILAGGTGKPFVTSDTGATLNAVDLNCDIVLKATKVDGIYDKDPVKHPDAKKFDKLTLKEAYEHDEIKVMDKEALAMAMENKLPIKVFDVLKDGNIVRAAFGEDIGTTVS